MAQSEVLRLEFRRGDKSADEIQAAVDGILTELHDPASSATRRVQQAGLKPADLADVRISVEEQEAGAEPLTAIAIGIAVSVGSHIGKQLWDKVIWPEIQRRLGSGALAEEKTTDKP